MYHLSLYMGIRLCLSYFVEIKEENPNENKGNYSELTIVRESIAIA